MAMVFITYMRVWHAGFIWDDDDHLTRNPCIIGPLGFRAIWTSSKAVYYPLVLTSFWIQHAIWGLNPLPYHLVDVALHAACAILLWRVLRRLHAPGAWLGAAIWALHPVQVESAAWITEQKNTQSCLFYMLAILFFLRWLEALTVPAEALGTRIPGARFYWSALLCATLAILSKSSTVMLPAVLGLCWWWMDPKWLREGAWHDWRRWRGALWLAPFCAVSAAASAWTIWEQKYANHALGAEWSQSWPQRFIIAGKDIWFYLGKLAWPHPLIFIYPVWSTDVADWLNFLPLLAVAAVTWCLWSTRHGMLRAVFFAWAYFVVSLFPVLSFFNVYFFRYSFVGDHFQYLASIGPLALAGAGIAWATAGDKGGHGKEYRFTSGGLLPVTVAVESRQGIGYPLLAGVLLTVLAVLTWFQCGTFLNLETLWRRTVADNPKAWIAHFNLADILRNEGRMDEAADQYRQQLQIMPDSVEAMGNLAGILALQHHTDEAAREYQALLSVEPRNAQALSNLATIMVMEGHVDAAVKIYEAILFIDPENIQANGNLAVSLLREGRAQEAISHAQRAVNLAREQDSAGPAHDDAMMLRILAAAYAKAGRFPEAISAAQQGLQRARSEANPRLAAALEHELSMYQANNPQQ